MIDLRAAGGLSVFPDVVRCARGCGATVAYPWPSVETTRRTVERAGGNPEIVTDRDVAEDDAEFRTLLVESYGWRPEGDTWICPNHPQGETMNDLGDLIDRSRRERVEAEERLREQGPDGYAWEPKYGFGKSDRVVLASAVEAIRRKVCCYAGDPCDCKYGLGIKLVDGKPSSEATGCPELRSVVRMLLHPEVAA